MTSPSDRGGTRLSLLGRSALRYAEQGWAVFPLWARDKTPRLQQNWREIATTDTATITEWWRDHPESNIALPTGSEFDVLDIDGVQGIRSLNELAPRYRHDGPLVLTGRGYHCYMLSTGAGNRANFREKLDFRGVGGYVVAPPSIHPDGSTYRWDTDHHRGIAATLWPAPDWLLELLDSGNPDGRPIPTIVQNSLAATRNPAANLPHGAISIAEIPADQLPSGLRIRKNRPDILVVASQIGLQVRPRSNYWVARCIFGTHTDTTPSLTLYKHDNSFHCYGCGAHGDSYDLLNRTFIGDTRN